MTDTTTDNAATIACPAKLNLTLAVGPPRADGLHPIASVMVVLDFADRLSLIRLADGPSSFERAWHADAPRRSPIDWPIESDLVYKAHTLMEVEASQPLPVRCELLKYIPAGAGLGGGSSNAAGMLVGLRDLFALPIADERLVALGSTLGADVAFAVHALLGQRAALVTGIGDIITSLPALPAFNAVLIFPDGGCPTGAVYRAFDEQLAGRPPADPIAHAQQWRSLTRLPAPHNDLTDAAITVCPDIGQAMDTLRRLGAEPRLTGSGSTLFVAAESAFAATQFAEQARAAGLIARTAAYHPAMTD